MSTPASPRLTVTVRTRPGQVIDRELSSDESVEVYEALLQMVAALFSLSTPEHVRSVTFDIVRH